MKNKAADAPAQHGSRIVVGVDGSPSSVGALRHGARIAAALELPLEAITTWQYPDLYDGYISATFLPSTADLSSGAQAMLDETAQAAFGDDRPARYHGSVHEGRTAQTLIEESKGAEMLVVGSRGHGGFAGLLLGSVSQTCAEHATCPVLVFHGEPMLAET